MQVQGYRQFLTPETGGVAVLQSQWVKAARTLRFVLCSQFSQSVVVILFGTGYTRSADGQTFLQPSVRAQHLHWRSPAPAAGCAALSNTRDALDSLQSPSLPGHKLILCSGTGIVPSPLPSFPLIFLLNPTFIYLFRLHTQNN